MPQASSTSPLIGKRYQLHERLGRGGMGEVYRATDRLTGQTVALKRVILLVENQKFYTESESTDFRLALAQEFKVLASLRHPHIISVLDYGFDDHKLPYITMEYLIEAQNFVTAGRGETVERQVDLLIQLLQALAYLHRRDILHRDLKPGNVLVTAEGQVKVLDFGLAMAPEEASETAGTLAYMAPEVIQGKPPSESADLYAVGIMAYEMLTGRHPFNTNDPQKLIGEILTHKPDLSLLQYRTLRGLDIGDQMAKTLLFDNALRDDATDVVVKLESPGLDENKTLIGLPEMETAHFGSDAFPPGEIEVVGLEGEVASGFDTLAGIVGRLLAKTATERYHDAYEVITDLCAAINQPVPEESAAIRESFLVAAKFVGRETELGALEAALAQSVQGKGSAWLLSGESGVGKSRLSDELRTRALVQGVVVLRSEGVAGGGLPYELWREPLRRLALTTDLTDLEAGILCDLVQDIDHLLEHPIPEAVHLEGTAYQNRLLGTIASVFQRQTQPLLLLLEDLQWSSESLEVLRLLNGMVGELPVMIVGNYRHEERPGLPDELPGMHILKVERLTAKSIAELSVSMLGEAGRQKDVLELLQRETEGNVYFLVEVMRALAEEAGRLDRVGQMSLPQHVVAGGIQAVIRRRLERVPEEGRLLVQLAAVAGRELDLAVLEHVNGALDIDEWLTICANVAVLEVQDGQWRFSHDKLRESTLNALPPDRLAALHGQIAQAIEATYPDSEDQAVRLSQHWRNAGNVNKELYYLRLAGDHAMHISVYADAISYYERALELLPSASLAELDPQSIEADLFIKLGEALQHIGDYPKATRRLEMGLERSRRLNDNAGAARALGVLSDVYWRQGDYARATDACQESLALSRSIDDPRGIARALNRLGMVASEQGNYAEAVRNLEESLAFAGQSGDLEASATVINNLGTVAYAQGDYDRASRYFEETLAISQASGERRKAATALLNLGSVAGEKGDYARATQHFEETLAICRAIGERRGVALALDNLGFLAELQGNHTAAIKHFEASLAIARAIGNRRGSATTLVNLGNVSRAQGQTERAIDFYHQALSLAREIEAIPTIMEILTGLAGVVSDTRSALAWLGLVLSHSATFEATRKQATRILDEKFRPMVSARQIEDGLQQGKGLDVMAVVTKILQERADSYFAQR